MKKNEVYIVTDVEKLETGEIKQLTMMDTNSRRIYVIRPTGLIFNNYTVESWLSIKENT